MAYGIDFGTTNSAVVWDATTLLDTGQNRPFPSVVAIDRATGHVITGPKAREQRERLEQSDYIVITSVKKYLGRPMSWCAGGKVWTPRMVACELFKGLREHARTKAELTRNTPLDRAVVSIPVGFTPARREELRAAAEDAGIQVVDLISEPTAAFLRCREELPGSSIVAVFDWGGGTLDVSVLEIDGDRIRELDTAGLERAGDDIDWRIAEWLHNRAMQGRQQTVPFESVAGSDLDNLLVRTESAKIELSSGQRPAISINLASYLGSPMSIELNRDALSAILRPFLDDAVATLQRAIQNALPQARVRRHEVDSILLVGGSSRLLGLNDRLDELYSERVHPAMQPDWAVSQGASELARQPGHYELMQRVYLVLSDDTNYDLLRDKMPFDGTPEVHHVAVVEECKAAQLVFAESENPDAGATDTSPERRQIGNLSVPVMGFDSEPIEIKASLTHNLTLRVTAKSMDGNAADERIWEYDRLRFAYVAQS